MTKQLFFIGLDGYAFDDTHYLFESTKKMGNQYKIFHSFFKESGACWDTILTGRDSRNQAGLEIKIDNLAK